MSTSRCVVLPRLVIIGILTELFKSIPIPSYLIAIAVGDVTFMAFDPVAGKDWTSGVWAEPGKPIADAYEEFRYDTTK